MTSEYLRGIPPLTARQRQMLDGRRRITEAQEQQLDAEVELRKRLIREMRTLEERGMIHAIDVEQPYQG